MTNSPLPADPLNVSDVDFDDPVAMSAFHQLRQAYEQKIIDEHGDVIPSFTPPGNREVAKLRVRRSVKLFR